VRGAGVDYYPDRSLVAASGHVKVTLGKRTIAADEIRYDTQHDRLLAAGHVQVTDPRGTLSGAAYTLDPNSGAQRLLRIDPEPLALRIDKSWAATEDAPPAGTFEAEDLSGEKPYLRGKHAQILAQTSVRMTPAVFPNPVGPSGYLPTFLYSFAPNANLYLTSLPTVTFSQPLGLAGGEQSLTQLVLRYDTYYGAGAGIEQHLINGNRSYLAVAGIVGRNPTADLNAYTQIGGLATANVTASTLQGYNSIVTRFTYSIPNAINASLTGAQATGASAQSINASTMNFSLLHHLLGYKFNLGYTHVWGIAQTPYESEWSSSAGGSVYTNNLKGPFKTNLGIVYSYLFTGFNFPHNTLGESTSFSLYKSLPHNISFSGSAVFTQSFNRYRYNAAYYLGLPPPDKPLIAPDGTPYPGYFAYQGFSTQRVYSGAVNYQPNGNFSASFLLVHQNNFPVQFHGYGYPPLAASFNMRVRITPAISLQYSRTYDFGWGGEYFVPGASFVITP
jgi:hypothetical protein